MDGLLRAIMGRILTLTAGLLLLLQASTATGACQQSLDSKETSLPEPPQQRTLWTPPQTTLPGLMVTATAKLFEHGMADPRGCEYREVEIRAGNVWNGEAAPIKIHAWLMPARPAEKERYSVGWNGLIYPVVSIGNKANLRADMLAALQADEEVRSKWIRDSVRFKAGAL